MSQHTDGHARGRQIHQHRMKKDSSIETWMNDLPDELRMNHMSHLVIPGSHHAMSFSIGQHSPLSGDYSKMQLTGIWKMFAPLFSRKLLARWSRVQSADLTAQLCMGIRYFDVRVEFDETSSIFRGVHLMKSEPLNVGLATINSFLVSHPREVVILDFQHFIGFPAHGHSSLKHLLNVAFEEKLCPNDIHMSKISLDAMCRRGYQVIVVCRKYGSQHHSRSSFFPILYSKTESPDALIDSVIDQLSIPWPDKWFIVVHMILKPERRMFPYKRYFHDARSYAKTALAHSTRSLVEYLKGSTARPTVFVADFVDINDAEFSKMIVALNYVKPLAVEYSVSSPSPVRSRSCHHRRKPKNTDTSDDFTRDNISL